MAWKVSFGSWRPNSACFKRIWTKPCLHCLVDIKAKDFFLGSTDVTSREALEMLHRARKLINSSPRRSMHLATGSPEMHGLPVDPNPFLYARRAVQAIRSLAPKSGVFVRMACQALQHTRDATSLNHTSYCGALHARHSQREGAS